MPLFKKINKNGVLKYEATLTTWDSKCNVKINIYV